MRVRSTSICSSSRPESSRASNSKSSTRCPIRSDSAAIRVSASLTCGGRSSPPTALRKLGVAAHDGDRRSEFVAGVGDEVPKPVLARMPLVQRRLDVVEHVIERVGDLARLSAWRGDRDPLGQQHGTRRQRQARDLVRSRGDAPQRPQREAHA